MENIRIIGYRAHPEFSTLMQTVYECGHAYSTPLHEFRLVESQEIRCAKCVTGAPLDISPAELSQVCNQTPANHPVIGRLAAALRYHLGMSEKRQYLEQEPRSDLDEAISEARYLLELIGNTDTLAAASPATGEGAEADEAGEPDDRGSPDPAASGIYYFELPDLSLI